MLSLIALSLWCYRQSVWIRCVSIVCPPGGSRWKKSSLSDAMLKELRERCPNISTLELVKVNLTNVSVECLPPRLERLGVISSLFPCGWFRPATDAEVLPSLRQLDLSDSGKTSNSDISGLCHCRHITELKLNGCYRLTDAAAKVIADSLPDLETLEMSGTSCTDLALHHISRHLTQLTSVNMAACTAVTDFGIGLIGHGLVRLKYLSLDRCPSVTDAGIEQLTSLKQLQFLDVTATKVTQSAADRFKMALPRCNVAL